MDEQSVHRMTWDEICRCASFRGRWVAMDECSFDEATGQATEGLVVDADEDLAELCTRIREAQMTNCSIMFADVKATATDDHSVAH